jgi:gamma-glutamyl hercynylcysteine S-oxide synthase
MHPYDRFFFDGKNYTVQRWLDDVNARYGGVDSILMWPTCARSAAAIASLVSLCVKRSPLTEDFARVRTADTNIGADARSQFDLFSAMPGGLAGVRAAVDELHAAGVKVLLPYNPWDRGSRRVTNASGSIVGDPMLLDGLIKAVDADGFNGDTMGSVPESFWTTSEALDHPVAIEPEGGGQASLGFANWVRRRCCC